MNPPDGGKMNKDMKPPENPFCVANNVLVVNIAVTEMNPPPEGPHIPDVPKSQSEYHQYEESDTQQDNPPPEKCE